MIDFSQMLDALPEFREIRASLGKGDTPLLVTGLADLHAAMFIAALHNPEKNMFVIVPDEPAAVKLCEELTAAGREALLFPADEIRLREVEAGSREYEHERLGILARLAGDECGLAVVASAEAALRYTLPPEKLRARRFTLRSGMEISPESLSEKLVAAGYEFRPLVEGRCVFSRRGGIVDFFPPAGLNPVRAEFWGDEIDSISEFDIISQRRTEPLESADIFPARETADDTVEDFLEKLRALKSEQKGKYAPLAKSRIDADIERLEGGASVENIDKYISVIYEKPATLFDYMGDSPLFVLDSMGIKQAQSGAVKILADDIKTLLQDGELFRGCGSYTEDFTYLLTRLESRPSVVFDTFMRRFGDVSLKKIIPVNAVRLAAWSGDFSHLTETLAVYRDTGFATIISIAGERGAKVLTDDLVKAGFNAVFREHPGEFSPGSIAVTAGGMSAGFEFPGIKLACVVHGRASAPAKTRGRRKNKSGDPIKSLSDIQKGDYVVHVTHGIGLFDGIIKKELHGVTKDYIKIKYAGTDTLFVPITQLDLVSKYVGAREDGKLRLNKLNSVEWSRTKARVKKAVEEMAEELVKLYAERERAKGFAFGPDTEWQKEFEQRFEFEETDDQLRCVAEIKEDMEKIRPMDRLLCGDVGFGKTEVAIRAAFKCAMDSKQTVVLVPTTILAWQHHKTFTERMESYPMRVELLSRFVSPSDRRRIISDTKKGLVDVLIGTHSVIQKTVGFKDLGLVIIDEEQRFGVMHKEKLKQQFTGVDTLTLSATPIPRTLNMAMSGIRDMSLIEEAPMDRHPVQSYVMEHSPDVIKNALQKELRRGGQVFYLHNRVGTIDLCAKRIRDMVPDARVVTAHGKMGEEELSDVWQRLNDREIDVLVCTTIIETGVDVSNCNTLIIENADRMGLSQLYQLRGRVGRGARRAYAYFMFEKDRELSEVATKRLLAIKEFTAFGSGFRIALRDLEIRGAGNILGTGQHGHMEAVGYDMYLRLLAEAVGELRGEPVSPAGSVECTVDINVEAHIPERYISDMSARIDVYKKIAGVTTDDDALDVTDELIDRFGEPPAAVKGLIDVALVRGKAAALGIREIVQKNDGVFLYLASPNMEGAAALAHALPGRVLLSAGVKPYISVKGKKNQKPTDLISEALAAMKINLRESSEKAPNPAE